MLFSRGDDDESTNTIYPMYPEDFQRQVLKELRGLSKRMDKLEARMDKIEARMDKIEARLDKLEGRMDKLEARVGYLEQIIVPRRRWKSCRSWTKFFFLTLPGPLALLWSIFQFVWEKTK